MRTRVCSRPFSAFGSSIRPRTIASVPCGFGGINREPRVRSFATTRTRTADGTRLFFEWLEQKFGARFGGKPLPMDDSAESMVVTRNSLEPEDLQKLFHHEIAALVVKGFYPAKEAADLGRDLANDTQSAQNWKVSTSKGLESSDVFTTGKHPPYNIAVANNRVDEYFDAVRSEFKDRRRHIHRMLWPLDLLRLELDEVWPKGAGLARSSEGKCMGGGLPRLMVGPTRWKKGLVHVDELAPLQETGGCFSANVYLQLPYSDDDEMQEQPVMEVWPLGIRSKWDWYRNALTLSHLTSQDPEGQVILRKVLGKDHKQRISVRPGDLVLLCVQRPHCAIGFGHDDDHKDNSALQTRVSLQCFLQYNGNEERLTIDS